MPSYVVRASRDSDSPYLLWSTVVDNATVVALDRAEIAAYLADEGSHPDKIEERLKRADEHGTSAIEPAGYLGWDDSEFLVTNTTRADAFFFDLPRDRLADYARHLYASEDAAAEALLIPRPDTTQDDGGEKS